MEAQVDTLCLLAQPKEEKQFKNKKQPELTENRTAWKSNNQGDKEETLTQTSRRDRDRRPGGEDSRQAEAGGPSQAVAAAAGGPSFTDKLGGTTGE